jgi:regulator of protease activity HflC (stomatin/prohibitin superfamily)
MQTIEITEKPKALRMKNKYAILGGLAALGTLIIWICFLTRISPGYVGVIVNQFGSSRGVESNELHAGMYWIPPWKTVYQFPIFEQNEMWETDKECFHFQTSEGMAISASIGITFRLNPSSVPMIFQRYRRGMDEITNTFIRNFIRDAINKSASKMTIEDLYGKEKEGFFDLVESHVSEDLKDLGIELRRIYLIGRFHFPDNVIKALNAKIEAVQRAQQRENELREAEAEAKKNIATAEGAARCAILEAQAEAESNKLVAASVTQELIQWEALQKWDGKLPQIVGETIPFIDLRNKSTKE